jgi:glutaredoxin 3
MKVNIITKSYCPYCHAALQLLDSLWVEYKNIDVISDEAYFEKVEAITWSYTVPQVFAGDIKKENFLWWYTEIASLHNRGELTKILEK